MQEAIICTRWLTFPQSLLPLSTAWGFESDMISVWHSEQSSATVIKHLGHSTLSLDKVGGVLTVRKRIEEEWIKMVRLQIWQMMQKKTLIFTCKYTENDERFVTGWKLKQLDM